MGRHHRAAPPTDWQAHAACRDADPDLFFPPDGASAPEREVLESAARLVCLGCPVREPCLSWALAVHERNGVWGGTTEEERRALHGRRPTSDADVAIA